MSLLHRLFGRAAPVAETRDAGSFYAAMGGTLNDGYSGGHHSADRLSTVSACVRLICGSMATLPPSVTIDAGSGREPAPASSPVWKLLQRPSRFHSWPSFVAWVAREILLNGNALCKIETDGRGAVSGLQPVPWRWVSVEIVSSSSGGSQLAYRIASRSAETDLLGLSDRLLENEVLHIRGPSDAGMIGESVLARARGPVTEGLEIEKLAASTWRNGARPSATLTLPGTLDDARRKRFKEEFLPAFTGALNAGRVPILEGGWKFEPIGLSSVDSQFLEMRQLNLSQIAMLFGVPEVLLHVGQRIPGDMSQFVTQFAQLALAPLVASIEAEFDHAVLGPNLHLQIDLDGLQRGSFASTVAALAALKQSGIVSANDARQEMGFAPVPDGNGLASGPAPAPTWPADGPGSKHLAPSPGPHGPSRLPTPGTNENGGST